MLGWLMKLYLLDDRFIVILFRIFKFGVIRTNDRNFNGFSFVFGISKIELQINLSFIKNILVREKDYADA